MRKLPHEVSEAWARKNLVHALDTISLNLSRLVGSTVKPTMIEVKEGSIYFHLVAPHMTSNIARRVETGDGWIVDIASKGPVGVQLILSKEEQP